MVTKVSSVMLEDGTEAVGLVPIGAFVPFAGATPPANWLLAYGQTLVRADYLELAAALGFTSGTNFTLPDLRGRTVAGRDNMGGTPANRLTSAVSGVDGATLLAAGGNQNLHQHSHAVTDPGHSHTVAIPGTANGPTGTSEVTTSPDTGSTSPSTTGITLGNAGTGSSQNVQPTIVLNWIIRAK